MTDQITQPAAEPAPAAAPEAPQYDPSDIERAKATGWRPIEDWKGDPERHIPPDEWNRRADEVLPIAQATNRKLQDQLQQLTRQLGETQRAFDERVARQEKMTADALARQRAQIHEQYEGAKRAAAAKGDVEAFDQLEAQKRTKLKDVWDEEQSYRQETAPRQQQNQPPPEVRDFASRNPWFGHDTEMTKAADAVFRMNAQANQDMSLADNLADVERRLQQRFPSMFPGRSESAEPAARASAVEGSGGRVSQQRSPANSMVAKLPPEALAAADKFIKQGLYKDRAEYAKAYFEG